MLKDNQNAHIIQKCLNLKELKDAENLSWQLHFTSTETLSFCMVSEKHIHIKLPVCT